MVLATTSGLREGRGGVAAAAPGGGRVVGGRVSSADARVGGRLRAIRGVGGGLGVARENGSASGGGVNIGMTGAAATMWTRRIGGGFVTGRASAVSAAAAAAASSSALSAYHSAGTLPARRRRTIPSTQVRDADGSNGAVAGKAIMKAENVAEDETEDDSEDEANVDRKSSSTRLLTALDARLGDFHAALNARLQTVEAATAAALRYGCSTARNRVVR